MPDRPLLTPIADVARDRVLETIVRTRIVFAPLFGSLALTFAYFETSLRARATLACAVALMLSISFLEFYRFRKRGLAAVLVPLNTFMPLVGQLLIASATGGLFSPLIPIIFVVVLLTGLLTSRSSRKIALAIVTPVFWLFALVHTQGYPVDSLFPALYRGLQPVERSYAPWIAAALYTLFVTVAARVGGALQTMFEELAQQRSEERDRALSLNVEQSRTLAALTGEIAHELKNPLSSIKGLAALVAKDVSGRSSERMTVLREEVVRMQTILDEFLNFSRPLVPLTLTELDLAELAREVLELHEGSASEREVTLSLEQRGAVHTRGDARKIRQILINLLQNALEASPRGGSVEVLVEGRGESCRVSVRDRGPGVPEELRDRLFEVGVTTKEHGSGIGLVVARSLARQHGGELALKSAAASGALLLLTLPREPTGVER